MHLPLNSILSSLLLLLIIPSFSFAARPAPGPPAPPAPPRAPPPAPPAVGPPPVPLALQRVSFLKISMTRIRHRRWHRFVYADGFRALMKYGAPYTLKFSSVTNIASIGVMAGDGSGDVLREMIPQPGTNEAEIPLDERRGRPGIIEVETFPTDDFVDVRVELWEDGYEPIQEVLMEE